MKRTLEGVVHVSRLGYMEGRKRRVHVLVCVFTDEPAPMRIGHGKILRRKLSTWPAVMPCEGHRVRVTAQLVDWRNGLGWYVQRPVVECLAPEEHVLAALAGIHR